MGKIDQYYNNIQAYTLQTDEVVVGANKKFLDIFNAVGSGKNLLFMGLYLMPKSDVAVTGVVSARFDIYKTNSVGTGGTAAVYKSPLPNVPVFAPRDTMNADINTNLISARSALTGGANIDHYVTRSYVFPEETNSATILQQYSDNIITDRDAQPLVLREGEGLLVQQGSVASVNSFSIFVLFGLTANNPVST